MRKMQPQARLQITRIIATVGGKGSKPRLWGYYNERASKPSSCSVTTFTAGSATTRLVK